MRLERRVRLVAWASLALFASALLAWPMPSVYAESKPITDWSFYVETTSNTAMYDLGCNQGSFDASHGTSSLVFLDFGGQNSSGTGTLEIDGTSVSNAQIESMATNFANGYYTCTGSDTTTVLTEAIGTNNSYYDVSSGGGQTWAGVIKSVKSDASAYASQVTVWAGNDIEPSFNSWANTSGWIAGYSGVDPAPYLDYGSADGCSSTSHANGSCSNGWTTSDVYYAAWGAAPAEASPEIYYAVNAQQWTQISLYGYYSGPQGVIDFEGPLDENDLNGSTLTSSAAWTDLNGDLSQYSVLNSNMTRSLEVHDGT